MPHRSARQRSRLRAVHAAATLVVSLGLMLTISPAVQPGAHAVEEICWLDASGSVVCPDAEPPVEPETLVSPEAYRAMTADQEAAMRRLEQQAVEGVLTIHHLPPEDRDDVLRWDRDEAAGLLQMLVVKAANTPVASRTPDQRQVATWIHRRATERTVRTKIQAGAEYAAWAGFDVDRYWQLIHGGASKDEVKAFLSRAPQPFSGSSRATSTGGYCVYVPPAPYSDDYSGRNSQTCYQACTNVWLGLCMPQLTYEDFLRWAEARVRADQPVAHEATVAKVVTISKAASIGGALASGGMVPDLVAFLDLFEAFTPLADEALPMLGYWNDLHKLKVSGMGNEQTSFGRVGVARLRAQAFQNVWMGRDGPFKRSILSELRGLFRNPVGLLTDLEAQVAWLKNPRNLLKVRAATSPDAALTNMTWYLRETTWRQVQSRIGRLAATITKMATYAGSGWLDLVDFAVSAAIDGAFMTAEQVELPAKIASGAVLLRDIDRDALFTTTNWLGPELADNAVRTAFAESLGSLSASADDCGEECPDIPVRPVTASDPTFMVRPLGSTSGTRSTMLDIGKVVDDHWTPSIVRASGRWFVEKWFRPDVGMESQSLAFTYTNHSLQPETAWLEESGGHLSFVVVSAQGRDVNLETCIDEGTCWPSDVLHYMDQWGNPMVASLARS